MGKSRGSGGNPTNSGNGESPTISDMDIPQGRSTVTEIPAEDSGAKTTLQQNEEKIQEELSDLTFKLFELDRDKATAFGAVKSQRKKIQRLQDKLDASAGHYGPATQQLRETIEKETRKLEEITAFANERQKEYNDVNRRIHTLETGFDTGDNSDWITEIETDEEEHGL